MALVRRYKRIVRTSQEVSRGGLGNVRAATVALMLG